jgi:hypothetical protein
MFMSVTLMTIIGLDLAANAWRSLNNDVMGGLSPDGMAH